MTAFTPLTPAFIPLTHQASQESSRLSDLESCSKRWTHVHDGHNLHQRCLTSLTYIGSNRFVVFGGGFQKDDGEWDVFSDTWMFDIAENSWNELECEGEVPCERGGHTAVGWKDRLILFGGDVGSLDDEDLLADCWRLQVDIPKWREVPGSGRTDSPCARTGATSVLVQGSFLMFGGRTIGDDEEIDVFRLNLQTWIWSRCESFGATDGVMPLTTYCSAAQAVGQSSFLRIGGRADGTLLNEVWHAAVDAVAEDQWQILWTALTPGGIGPSPRMGLGLALVSKQCLVVFGGKDNSVVYNDAYLLFVEYEDGVEKKIRSCDWKPVQEGEQEGAVQERPSQRRAFAMSAAPDVSGIGMRFYVFGGEGEYHGVAEESSFSDLWVFDLDFMDHGLEKMKSNFALATAALTRRMVGLARLFLEDILQGCLQAHFLYEFWDVIQDLMKVFTIGSITCGLTCSVLGPITEYYKEMASRKEQEIQKEALAQFQREAAENRALLESTIQEGDLESGEGETDALIGRGPRSPARAAAIASTGPLPFTENASAQAGNVPTSSAKYADPVELFQENKLAYATLLLMVLSFWGFIAVVPFLLGEDFDCASHIPIVSKVLFWFHLISSLGLELIIIRQTQLGQTLLKRSRGILLVQMSLSIFGRYDVFSDLMFLLMASACGYSLARWSLVIFLLGVVGIQALPGITLIALRRNWAYGFKLNDMNVLLASTDLARGVNFR